MCASSRASSATSNKQGRVVGVAHHEGSASTSRAVAILGRTFTGLSDDKSELLSGDQVEVSLDESPRSTGLSILVPASGSKRFDHVGSGRWDSPLLISRMETGGDVAFQVRSVVFGNQFRSRRTVSSRCPRIREGENLSCIGLDGRYDNGV